MPKRQSGNKKGRQSNFAKLSIFQPNKNRFKKSCPLSIKGAPKIDYNNIKLLRYLTIKVKKFDLNTEYFSKNDNSEKEKKENFKN